LPYGDPRDREDHLRRAAQYAGQWDNLLWHDEEIIGKHWSWMIRPGDVCIDAGFGPGGWTLVALAKGATVFAFDPKPYSVKILTELLAVNNFRDRCTIVQTGLGDKSTKEFLFENQWFPSVSLDEVVAEKHLKRLDHVCMDVEGHELEVVQGGLETIRRFHPRLIMEIHGNEFWDSLERELKSLADYGFERLGGFLIAAPRGG
jgi:FkbM family methyltransferase